MKKEEIIPWDWYRIWVGNAPVSFLLEATLRSFFLFLLLILVFRLLGKRMAGQLTLTEIAVILTLGAIVSVPMQIPERGLLLGIVGLTCVVVFQRGLNWFTVKYQKFNFLVQSKVTIVVKDGVLQLMEMKSSGISKQQIFAGLRNQNVFNLGKVKRLYFEGSGILSLFTTDKEKLGLNIFPIEQPTYFKNELTPLAVCKTCGTVQKILNATHSCNCCHEHDWTNATF